MSCDAGDGWIYNPAMQTCIKAFNSAVNWETAQSNCETIGGTLAMWDRQESLDLMQSLVSNSSTGEHILYTR